MSDWEYAFAPWIPTLLDVEMNKVTEPDGSPVDWRSFGWEALYVDSGNVHVISRFDILKTRFDERYANRMLNAETMERWQVRLQNRFDEVVDKYERAYTLYEKYHQNLLDDVIPGEKTTVTGSAKDSGSDNKANSGSDTNVGTSKYSDTPDSLINDSSDYAGNITKNDYEMKYGRNEKVDYGKQTDTENITEKMITGGVLIENLNKSIDDWKDIDTMFVSEFENNFLNVFWY